MYKGKQPVYVIGGLIGLLVIVGFLLFSFGDDENSALTGSTVIDVEPEQIHTDDIPEPVALGSASRPLDLAKKEVVDVAMKKEAVVGEYVVMVNNVKTMEKIGAYSTPETFHGVYADKMFYVVQASVMLTGLKEGYVPKGMFTLSDGKTEYFMDEEAAGSLLESNVLTQVMRTGVKRIVKIPFDVDVGTHDLLMYETPTKVYRMPLNVIKSYDVVV